ncbi:MAG: SpoVR family protein [Bacillota bacterium]
MSAAHGSTALEIRELERAIERIVDKALAMGLDPFPMRYEICPAEILYTFGAYGMPIRFSHWSFGKAFYRMKMSYDYGMSKIYELVINSDPCYAFLLETNSLLQNKVIAAHVLAHSDFFKRNWRFRNTNRQMVWTMAAFAERVRRYEQRYGRDRVERFLDAALALHEQIDPFPARQGRRGVPEGQSPEGGQGEAGRRGSRGADPLDPYRDLWDLDRHLPGRAEEKPPEPASAEEPRPPARCRDLLLFLMEKAPDLEDWQRDILSSIRAEALYFRPQMETKILNEGWASFWHARILRELDLTPEESVEFARLHAAVLAPNPYHLNPYHVGFYLLTRLEQKLGLEKLFEIRELETDVSFLRNYLDEQAVEDLDLYLYRKEGDGYRVTAAHREWEQVRDGIVRLITDGGVPYIYAEDHDFGKRGELHLTHGYEGVELDTHYLTRTLPHVHHIWGRPVHLDTVEDGRQVRYTCTGEGQVERKVL